MYNNMLNLGLSRKGTRGILPQYEVIKVTEDCKKILLDKFEYSTKAFFKIKGIICLKIRVKNLFI